MAPSDRDEVDKCTTGAFRGNIEDMEKLAILLEAKEDPHALLVHCFPIIFFHIRIPKSTSKNLEVECNRAVSAFKMLANGKNPRGYAGDILPNILAQWPNIWWWLKYFTNRYFYATDPKDQEHQDLRASIYLSMFTIIDDLAIDGLDTLLAIPAFMPFILDFWKREPSLNLPTISSATAVIVHFVRRGPKEVKQLIKLFKGDLYALVDTILERTRHYIEIPCQLPLLHLLNLINDLAHNKDIFVILREKHMLSLALQYMEIYADGRYPWSELNMLQARACVGLCTILTSRFLADGHRFVLEAMRSRVLLLVFKSHRLIPDTLFGVSDTEQGMVGLQDQFIFLIESITPYLVYWPIMREFRKLMRHLLRMEHRVARFERNAKPELWDTWGRAVQFFYEVEGFEKIYLERRKQRQLHICDNQQPEVVHLDVEGPPKRCGGCQQRFFCDKSCQTWAWVNGDHNKEKCNAIASLIRDSVPTFPDTMDKHYVLAWVDHYVDTLLPARIHKLYWSYARSAAGQGTRHASGGLLVDPMIIEVDHSISPFTLKLVRQHEFRPKFGAYDQSLVEEFLQLAKILPGMRNTAMVHLILPESGDTVGVMQCMRLVPVPVDQGMKNLDQ
ncbi:hypothetical protein C8J56DRAFT_469105 [Mycena floridula]|nr:hypothetical protein C8J56DRAFT_469105 [Mycena floridula]